MENDDRRKHRKARCVSTGFAASAFGFADQREDRPSTGSGRALMVSLSNHARFATLAFLVGVVAVAVAGAQQQALGPPGDTAAVERGRAVLTEQCGFCHGTNARGGSSG